MENGLTFSFAKRAKDINPNFPSNQDFKSGKHIVICLPNKKLYLRGDLKSPQRFPPRDGKRRERI